MLEPGLEIGTRQDQRADLVSSLHQKLLLRLRLHACRSAVQKQPIVGPFHGCRPIHLGPEALPTLQTKLRDDHHQTLQLAEAAHVQLRSSCQKMRCPVLFPTRLERPIHQVKFDQTAILAIARKEGEHLDGAYLQVDPLRRLGARPCAAVERHFAKMHKSVV